MFGCIWPHYQNLILHFYFFSFVFFFIHYYTFNKNEFDSSNESLICIGNRDTTIQKKRKRKNTKNHLMSH